MSKEKNLNSLGVAIFLLLLAIILLVISLAKDKKNNITIDTDISTSTNIIVKEQSKYPDYDYYKEMNKLELVKDVSSFVQVTSEGIEIEGRTEKTFIKSYGKIENAYLFIDISVDNNKPLTVWDSIFVSLRGISIDGNKQIPLDGHLLRSKTIIIPESHTTQLLFDLRLIPMTKIPYSDNNNFTYKDWLSLLQDNKKFEFETFLSTLREGGKINEITIGYKCSEDTQNCKLEIFQE